MMSVHDPEMRHGHKSSSRRFDGHKAAIVVDTDSQLITAVDVLPGNAPDHLGALELVEQSEANTGVPVAEAMGDAAYGDGDTRQAFADAGRRLVARVPGRPDRKHFPKDDFVYRPGRGQLHLSGGTGYPHHRASGKADGSHRAGPPLAGLPVRWGRMSDMSTAVPVHRSQGEQGAAGADPSPGSPAAAGPSVAAKHSL